MTSRAPVLARVLALALMLGVVAMHAPLDAFRSRPTAELPGPCCAASCADEPAEANDGDAREVEESQAPAPRDGCADGCHCGCCGRLPIADEGSVSAPLAEVIRGSRPLERVGARRHPLRDVFHPPRA